MDPQGMGRKGGGPVAPANRYCQRLGIPVPDLDAAARRSDRSRTIDNYSQVRRAAAILDAAGTPLALDKVNERLEAFAGPMGRVRDTAVPSPVSNLVILDPSGLVTINPASAHLPAMRRDLRKMALAGMRQDAEFKRQRARRPAFERARDEQERREIEEARRASRALVHVISVDGCARAAAVIDGERAALRLFTGNRLAELPAHVESFDFLAGAGIRPSLRALSLDPDRWWLAELRPPQRTFRPTPGGPSLPVSLEAVVEATIGKRRVPAGEAAWRMLIDSGSPALVDGRLEEEARTLFALYRYGALHRSVRLRQGGEDFPLPVSWSLPGDPRLSSFVDAAVKAWSPIELVVGPPPDPYEPEQLLEGQITRGARLVTLGGVVDHGHRQFTYLYDFGDSWRHTIEIEEVLAESDSEKWALCLEGARSCPPEDCGGPGGYEHLLEILFDPRHPNFEETRRWVGPGFDPEAFDLEEINGALGAIGLWT